MSLRDRIDAIAAARRLSEIIHQMERDSWPLPWPVSNRLDDLDAALATLGDLSEGQAPAPERWTCDACNWMGPHDDAPNHDMTVGCAHDPAHREGGDR